MRHGLSKEEVSNKGVSLSQKAWFGHEESTLHRSCWPGVPASHNTCNLPNQQLAPPHPLIRMNTVTVVGEYWQCQTTLPTLQFSIGFAVHVSMPEGVGGSQTSQAKIVSVWGVNIQVKSILSIIQGRLTNWHAPAHPPAGTMHQTHRMLSQQQAPRHKLWFHMHSDLTRLR